jgi:hypothetical protein
MVSRQIRIPLVVIFILFCFLKSNISKAQSPEISLREFASSQIKKGVRAISMGGNGATWGNYSLVWRDSSTALIDAGATRYTNANRFSFTAVAATTPSLWHRMTIYAIALSQYATDVSTSVKSPALGPSKSPVHGDGSNQAVFLKAALPLGKHFSFGMLLSYERSQFNATSDKDPTTYVKYHTNWLPSGGFGFTWQPNKIILIGFRALFNHDQEIRTDNTSYSEGLNLSHEYRLGGSVALWKDALLDIGGNIRYRYNEINNTKQTNVEPNLGFEQRLWHRHLALRAGLDETSPTAGIGLKFSRLTLDMAYIHNMAAARLSGLFGTTSNSIIASLIFAFAKE